MDCVGCDANGDVFVGRFTIWTSWAVRIAGVDGSLLIGGLVRCVDSELYEEVLDTGFERGIVDGVNATSEASALCLGDGTGDVPGLVCVATVDVGIAWSGRACSASSSTRFLSSVFDTCKR